MWINFLLYFTTITIVQCEGTRFFPHSKQPVKRDDVQSKPLKPTCNEDQLLMFLAEIQAINPESIINKATSEDVDIICDKVEQELAKTHTYLQTCKPPENGDLYYKLIRGVEALYKKLCSHTKFNKEFLQYYSCYHKLKTDYEDCSGPADWTEFSSADKICLAYRDIADCYYFKTEKACGKHAAKVMKELVQAVTDSILTVVCDMDSDTNPTVKALERQSSGTEVQSWSPIFTIGAFVTFILVT